MSDIVSKPSNDAYRSGFERIFNSDNNSDEQHKTLDIHTQNDYIISNELVKLNEQMERMKISKTRNNRVFNDEKE